MHVANEEGGEFFVCQTQLRASCALPHINLTGGLGSKHYYHKVTDKETEAWGGEAGLPISGAISEFASVFHEQLITTLCTLVPDE